MLEDGSTTSFGVVKLAQIHGSVLGEEHIPPLSDRKNPFRRSDARRLRRATSALRWVLSESGGIALRSLAREATPRNLPLINEMNAANAARKKAGAIAYENSVAS